MCVRVSKFRRYTNSISRPWTTFTRQAGLGVLHHHFSAYNLKLGSCNWEKPRLPQPKYCFFSRVVKGSSLQRSSLLILMPMVFIIFQSVLVGAARVDFLLGVNPPDLGWSLRSIAVTTDNLHFALASRKGGGSPHVKPKGIESFYPYVKVTIAIHDDTCLENGINMG